MPPKKTVVGKARGALFTPENIAAIVRLIDESPAPLSWTEIIVAAEAECGHQWTRQGLHKQEAIKTAYEHRKDGKARRLSPARSVDLVEKVRQQEQELRALRALVASYEERFVRYQHNANKLRIDVGRLEEPMPPANRRQTKAKE